MTVWSIPAAAGGIQLPAGSHPPASRQPASVTFVVSVSAPSQCDLLGSGDVFLGRLYPHKREKSFFSLENRYLCFNGDREIMWKMASYAQS